MFWKQCGLFQLWVSGRSFSKPIKDAKASKRDDEHCCVCISEVHSLRARAFEKKVEIPRIHLGKKQAIETQINEEAQQFARYLRGVLKSWSPRIATLN